MTYAELDVISNFTFLTGASHTEELVERAAALGLPAIAIADTNTFAGIVRAHAAALDAPVQLLVGTRIVLEDGQRFIALPRDRAAYGRLCRLLTTGKRRTGKGACQLFADDLLEWAEGSILIALEAGEDILKELHMRYPDHLYLALSPHYDGYDTERFEARTRLSENLAIPLVATGNVQMHRAARRPLADVLTCIRERCTVDQLGHRALLNSERRLKSPFEMHKLFKAWPDAVANTGVIAQACTFSLSELKYEYPDEITDGQPPLARLRDLTEEGLQHRYPDGVPLNVQAMVEREMGLIARLDYARYFLTVHDIVKFARDQDILCQGRGSAANSVICYALGVTSISPEIITMVFERFVSEARGEPPDIDVDFEHERREEVIQHIYEKYGRHRAGICATVIHFRSKAAIREVGKAMGLSQDAVAALSSQIWGWSDGAPSGERLKSAGLNPADSRIAMTMRLISEIIGFPRHLSQHVGGFVITRGRLDELVPVENAAMEDRTVIEWDKDDIDVLGMLKIDVLGLGMLSVIRKAFDLLEDWKGTRYTLATIPQEDAGVYEQISQGDTTGLFQVESRAQMNFLPRMRPQCFYDLVIEVAIIRPGPIQGDMVHPYLKRRRGEEKVVYPSPELEEVLKRTLGVPLFQEQAMQIAMVAAGFDPGEADALRRALGAFRKVGSVSDFHDRFIAGCLKRGYDRDFAERCFKQLEGFSGYGFPESHAASFALLVYASGWLRHHHPEVYCAAILNSQPMGFYAPAQLVADARRHGVEVRPVDINASTWDCALEPDGRGGLAVRLGLRQIKGFKQEDAQWLAAARGNGYRDVSSVWRRAGLLKPALEKLAMADAFASIGLDRREALWHAKAVDTARPMPLLDHPLFEDEMRPSNLPSLSHAEDVFEDFISVRLSLKDHPVKLVRRQVRGTTLPHDRLRDIPQNQTVSVLGAVITRQRPATASGVIFVTLEDETGTSNIIVWPKVFERFRREVMQGRLLKITGKVQKEGLVVHVIATGIEDHSCLFDQLGDGNSIDMTWSSQDEARRPVPDHRQNAPRYAKPPEKPPAMHPRDQSKRLFASRDFR
ncbi:error-prone DNA polymerase [Aquisalinus flavus]|uniref:Error-prone DNA polymerase n=1 Tax=Aquisalinus flavus TaxID=1526572 RepID=A0A8J2V5F4_9PROT|nr:error-prone DNA polymerase [Aquisalinus flavus]